MDGHKGKSLPKVHKISFSVEMSKNTTPIRLFNSKQNALIDTGADISCISNKLFTNATSQQELNIEKSRHSHIIGVGNAQLKVIGKVTLPITFGDQTILQPCHIIEDLHHGIILGQDFLDSKHVTINSSDCTLTIYDKCMKIISQSQSGYARTRSPVTIKAHHKMDIKVTISKHQAGDQVLLEPIPSQNHQLIINRCLVKIWKGGCLLNVINPTDNDINLQGHKIVASVFDVDAKDIISLSDLSDTEQTPIINTINANKSIGKEPIDFDLSKADIDESHKQELRDILANSRDAFATSLSELGHTNLYQHIIETTDEIPVRLPFYKQNSKIREETNKQVQNLLENNIIKLSTSHWHSPVVMVAKKTKDQYRLTVDYRRLNKKTVPMSFPLPSFDSILDTLGQKKAKYYSCLDLSQGYWQIPLNSDTAYKSAFITESGVYEWNRVPMGLINSASSFAIALSQALSHLNWKCVMVYVDDLIVFSQTLEEHMTDLNNVFQALIKARLTLNPNKCVFLAKEINYLGHVVSKNGVSVDPKKVSAIKEYPIPKTTTEIRSFLGMCNYYRKFVKSYSHIAAPLHKLTHKDTPYVWSEECNMAFEQLKTCMTTAPVLMYPSEEKKFILTTDASDLSVGYMLSQNDDEGRERAISYG